jgi:hypothetical protein
MSISKVFVGTDNEETSVKISRKTPDPTPSDVFDPYRDIINSVELRFGRDVSHYEADTVIPFLRSALDAFATGTVLTRILAGER